MEWGQKRVWEKEANAVRVVCTSARACHVNKFQGAWSAVYVDHMSGVKKGNDLVICEVTVWMFWTLGIKTFFNQENSPIYIVKEK